MVYLLVRERALSFLILFMQRPSILCRSKRPIPQACDSSHVLCISDFIYGALPVFIDWKGKQESCAVSTTAYILFSLALIKAICGLMQAEALVALPSKVCRGWSKAIARTRWPTWGWYALASPLSFPDSPYAAFRQPLHTSLILTAKESNVLLL